MWVKVREWLGNSPSYSGLWILTRWWSPQVPEQTVSEGKLLHYRCIQLQLFPQTSASSHRLVTLQSSIFSLILSCGPAVFDQRLHSTPFLFFLIWYESKKKKKKRETNSKPLVCKISSEKKMLDLTWWSSSKESACQCRGHRFHPWSRKIGRAAKPSCHSHWGLHTLEPVLCNERSHHDGQPELHKLERACEQQQTPSAAKINKQIKLKY